MVKKRLTALILLLVLFGGAFAGLPLSFADSNCSMAGGEDMDCCKAMLLQLSRASVTREEELLCALSCAQNGTTLPASVVRITPPAQTVHASQPMLTGPLSIPFSVSGVPVKAHSPPGSPPTYLRNLTLLI